MTKNLIFLILVRRNVISLDIQRKYTNIIFVDDLCESLNCCNFLYIHTYIIYSKIWISSLKYKSKYSSLEKGVFIYANLFLLP